ncbi:MAG: Transposase IS200 like protein [Planctomycetes bacterium ADurb.Bin126]|nr:MAG: Transposase IS200 like protein [Planctomycetes bacterium ADurb.Bin126]HOD83422.1 IS200/IS605 family transposase [Phycisphaerae bacterium]HQL75469.1 IS200/IS605 family transposase [Phycisphaerae bacterium]
MAQSLVKILVHVIFSTKHRRPFLTPSVAAEMGAYLGGMLREIGCPAIQIKCVSDHAHILCSLGRRVEIAELVEKVKTRTSKWVKTRSPDLAEFYWQAGYGAFSVSASNVDEVRAYILRQEEHHRQRTFQEEFILFLKKHNVEYDERFVWE